MIVPEVRPGESLSVAPMLAHNRLTVTARPTEYSYRTERAYSITGSERLSHLRAAGIRRLSENGGFAAHLPDKLVRLCRVPGNSGDLDRGARFAQC
jgi:hypothetical protein